MTSPNPNPGTPLAGPGYFPSPAGPRNIVLLLDGTSNQFSEHNTNLIKLLSVIKADESQLVYYSSGLGTVLPESSGAWGKLRQKGAQILDMGFALYVYCSLKVQDWADEAATLTSSSVTPIDTSWSTTAPATRSTSLGSRGAHTPPELLRG